MPSVKQGFQPILLRRWLSPDYPRVVCLPVGSGEIELLASTLSSLSSNTSTGVDILVIPLGVAQSQVEQVLLNQPKSNRIVLLDAVSYEQPWQAVLCGLPPRYNLYDLLLIRSGLEVPSGWDARLALAAYCQESYVAAVSPLSNTGYLFALLGWKESDEIAVDVLDHLLMTLSQRRNIEMPLLFSGCCYLRRAALRDIEASLNVAIQDCIWEETTLWLVRLFQEYGWHAVCCDHVYVRDHDFICRQKEMYCVEQTEEVQQVLQASPLVSLRSAVAEALQRHKMSGYVSMRKRQPLQLHIVNSWGGGLERWVRQYCTHDDTRDHLVLRSVGSWGAFGQRIALYRSATIDHPLRYWELSYPIRATAVTHLQYQAILDEVISEFGIESILVSSLIGHSLDVLNTGLPTVFVAHDYYPFCPAVIIYFHEVCEHCNLPRLTQCFSENEHNRFFRNVTAREWLVIRRCFIKLILNDFVQLAAPSASAVHHWRTLLPELVDKPFNIIPHGISYMPERLSPPLAGKKLRVVVLGSLAPQKGRTLLENIWPYINDFVELYLIGCGEEGKIFCGQPGITLVPSYQHEELSGILAEVAPEVGLLLSICPETFSYTLSELWVLGVPVVATNLGSFTDRIQDGVNSFLCSPQVDMIAGKLRWINANRSVLNLPRARLAEFRHRRIEEMIADYHVLTPLPEFSGARYFIRNANLEATITPVVESPVVLINPQARFSEVLREFQGYALNKLSTSPRFSANQRKWLSWLFHRGFRLLDAMAKRLPIR